MLEHDGEAASLLACLEGVRTAFLIDACVSGAPPGTVRRLDLARDGDALPDLQFGLSTHGFGLAEAIALGQALGSSAAALRDLRDRGGAAFETGESLSAGGGGRRRDGGRNGRGRGDAGCMKRR